jgi:hypothetical protein
MRYASFVSGSKHSSSIAACLMLKFKLKFSSSLFRSIDPYIEDVETVIYLTYSLTLKMEVTCSFETSFDFSMDYTVLYPRRENCSHVSSLIYTVIWMQPLLYKISVLAFL